MNTDEFYQVHIYKPHLRVNLPAMVSELHKCYHRFNRKEIERAITIAQYDVPTARELCQAAESQGITLATYLDQYEQVQDGR